MEYAKIISACAAFSVAAGGFALSPPAFAKNHPVVVVVNPDIVTRRISFADLNLASVSGKTALNRRVGGAIRSLCSEAIGVDDPSFATRAKDKKCRSSAWNQAGPQIERAVGRALGIASTGTSTVAATAITIALP
jgi:UrcA family protein